jgi:hypothetical protein
VGEFNQREFVFDRGDRIRDLFGTEGIVVDLSVGYPHYAYIVEVMKSRYYPVGSRLAIQVHPMLKRLGALGWEEVRRRRGRWGS